MTFGIPIRHNGGMAFANWFGIMPKVEVWQGLSAFVLNGPTAQAGFFEASQTVNVPEHLHTGQWGIVISGQIDLTIGGILQVFTSGMSYNIPSGVLHSATVHAGAVFIEVWEEHRLKVKE